LPHFRAPCHQSALDGEDAAKTTTTTTTTASTFLDVRHQCGPEYTTSLEVEMWGLWLALDCLEKSISIRVMVLL
jgi:hypothetical protein